MGGDSAKSAKSVGKSSLAIAVGLLVGLAIGGYSLWRVMDRDRQESADAYRVALTLDDPVRRDAEALVLLQEGADPNVAAPFSGSTILHLTQNTHTAEIAIERGANVNARDSVGRTPLMAQDSVGVVRVLLKANTDIQATSRDGRTAAHLVSSNDVLEELLKAGADPNAVDDSGLTPLGLVFAPGAWPDGLFVRGHWQDPTFRERRVELLLQHGADPTAVDDAGRSILDRVLGSGPTLPRNSIHPDFRAWRQAYYKSLRRMIEAAGDRDLKLGEGASAYLERHTPEYADQYLRASLTSIGGPRDESLMPDLRSEDARWVTRKIAEAQ